MNKLQHHLETHKIARREFADRIGVDQSVLSRFCRGHARPGLEKAVAIERATDGAVPAAYWVDEPQQGAEKIEHAAAAGVLASPGIADCEAKLTDPTPKEDAA